MKKIIVLLAILVMLMTFVACETQPVEETIQPVEVEGLLSEKDDLFEYTYYNHVLNEKGQIVKRRVGGDDDRHDTFEYDEQGRMIKNFRYRMHGDEFWTYTYDENGILVEERNGDEIIKYTYTLDNQGKILTKTSVRSNTGSPVDDIPVDYSYTYYSNGLMATETLKCQGDTQVTTFYYDSKGRVTHKICKYDDTERRSLTSYTYGVVGSYTPLAS